MADEILDRWIDGGGIRIHYLTLGNGAPIVLLHGGALGVSAAENWQTNMPGFVRREIVGNEMDPLAAGLIGDDLGEKGDKLLAGVPQRVWPST